MRSPNDIAVLDNRTHNSFVETKHHIAVKVLKTFTDKTQDAISSGNCKMGMTMETGSDLGQSRYPSLSVYQLKQLQ